jgi:hypothetical protein
MGKIAVKLDVRERAALPRTRPRAMLRTLRAALVVDPGS